METAGKGDMGTCWLAAERGAGFNVSPVFGNAVWVCNFMGIPFPQQTFKQDCYPLTPVCFDFGLLAKCLLQIMGRGERVAARFRYARTKRLREFPHTSPLLLSADGRVAPAPGEMPRAGWSTGPAPAAGHVPCDPL